MYAWLMYHLQVTHQLPLRITGTLWRESRSNYIDLSLVSNLYLRKRISQSSGLDYANMKHGWQQILVSGRTSLSYMKPVLYLKALGKSGLCVYWKSCELSLATTATPRMARSYHKAGLFLMSQGLRMTQTCVQICHPHFTRPRSV